MGQVLLIYLPLWDVELVRRRSLGKRPQHASRARKRPPPPLFLSLEIARQERVFRCCAAARAAGVASGMSLPEARALCPAARVLPLDAAQSRKSLELLAEWAMRFSPVVAVDPQAADDLFPAPEGLLLNVTGTAHLFGGEQLFLAEVVTRLQRLGFTARASIAPTVGAAWALSRHGPARLSVVAEQHLTAALSPLPISALRLPLPTRQGLHAIGVERIAELLRLPREGLLVRYGEEVLRRLDQAFGRIDEPIEPIRPAEPLIVRRLFEGATTQLEAVLLAMQELLVELSELLLARESGVRGLLLELHRINHPPASREIHLGRPSRDPRHLGSLLRPKVEGMNLGYGVEAVTLTATWTDRIVHDQSNLWKSRAGAAGDRALEELLDTLVNRWGEQRVLVPAPAASHVPELAYRLVPVTQAREPRNESLPDVPWVDRPSLLLQRPEPAQAVALQPDHPPRSLRWRGESYSVAAGVGPERIMAETTRDYFKVQLAGGRWLWVYREWETGHWFVHGVWA